MTDHLTLGPRRRRSGHTLMELITATVSSAMLLAGLGGVMLIANQIANTPAASTDRITASAVVNALANDLRYATFLLTRTSHAIEFVVADRDGNGSGERIRYEWSGVPGEPLLKTTNGGTPIEVVANVQDFSLNYVTVGETSAYTPLLDTPQALLTSYSVSPTGSENDITADLHYAQRIDPTVFAAIPANAQSWNATRIDFVGRRQGSGETLRVQLRSAGQPHGRPSNELLGEVAVVEDELSSGLSWNSLTFSSPVRGLSLSRPHSIVWRGTTGESGTAGRILKDNGAASGVSSSADAGTTWTYLSSDRVYYRLYGTYSVPGTTVNVTRTFASRVGIALQCMPSNPGQQPVDGHSRFEASVPLLNRPELLSAYWRADFDSDPTAIDLAGDGIADWVMASGGFNNGTLVAGVWQANGWLESRPKNDFTNVTTVEARCRNTSVGGNGAELRIQVDRQGGTHAPIIVRVQRQADGTQTLSLFGKSNNATEVKLLERKNLSSDFVRYRLTLLPVQNLVNLQINDQDEGTFEYSRFAPTGDDRFLTFSANTSTAEYDYVELRVAE